VRGSADPVLATADDDDDPDKREGADASAPTLVSGIVEARGSAARDCDFAARAARAATSELAAATSAS
jgi:hypothetical protein